MDVRTYSTRGCRDVCGLSRSECEHNAATDGGESSKLPFEPSNHVIDLEQPFFAHPPTRSDADNAISR